ncbi:MAG: 2'-5' RNA ligase family protein [Dermatophilaceae bacterium]
MSEQAVPVASCQVLTIGVAIGVPEPYAGLVRRARRGYGDPLADLVRTHVTLLGPTPWPPQALPAVETHLARVARDVAPFRIGLAGSGTFRPITPVVFLRLAQGVEGCAVLAGAVRDGPLAGEAAFPYHPHVTLAHGVADDRLDAAQRDFATYTAEFDVDHVSLYVLEPGAPWRVAGGFELTGAQSTAEG